jgi:polyhydroxyalkanoate synthase subunit PhaC
MTEGRAGNGGDRGEAAAPMAPFDVWTQWLRSNMGDAMAPPGASVPWLMPTGISTGQNAEALPEGIIRNDPLLQVVEQLWDANPMQNVLPISWV